MVSIVVTAFLYCYFQFYLFIYLVLFFLSIDVPPFTSFVTFLTEPVYLVGIIISLVSSVCLLVLVFVF